MSGSAIGAINEQRGGSVYTPMNGADREQKWKQMQEKSKIIVCFHICAFCPAFEEVGQGGRSKSLRVTNMPQF